MRPESPSAVSTVLRVGVVDRRVIVRDQLQKALSADSRLAVMGSFADWRAAIGRRLEVDLWVTSEPDGGGTQPRFSAESYDLGEVDVLCNAVHAATGTREMAHGEAEKVRRLLSPHEYAVLESTAAGLSATQTAQRLGVSVRSVETARRRAMEKLGATSGPEAVRVAHEIRGSGALVSRGAQPEGGR
ncbi:hypothetical protein DQ244_00745 [Blastococcus sp. TBT05-19]|uniref:response regulator transcription factor n=1 Tax=Blastococcus sp. TBT05-19 TaxID=2250581 RepID=UPI000DEA53D8|nr:LuxR C-terminal-related transcriptional regulator [Blastococcus sp. TBT05-19]RBY93936.1 hypothetical protein DQ244_00745 [Blastococcus sp. TBT05-19]